MGQLTALLSFTKSKANFPRRPLLIYPELCPNTSYLEFLLFTKYVPITNYKLLKEGLVPDSCRVESECLTPSGFLISILCLIMTNLTLGTLGIIHSFMEQFGSAYGNLK